MTNVNVNLTGQQMLDISYAAAAAVQYNDGKSADRLRIIAKAMLRFYEEADTVSSNIPRVIPF